MAKRVDFEDNANVLGESDALSTRQSKQLVVVEESVEVLNPFGVHISVEYNEVDLVRLAADIGINSSQNVSEDTILPLASRRVENSKELLLRNLNNKLSDNIFED